MIFTMAVCTLHFKGSEQNSPQRFEASRPKALHFEHENLCVISQCYLIDHSIHPWSTPPSEAFSRNATSLMIASSVLPISTPADFLGAEGRIIDKSFPKSPRKRNPIL